MLPTTFISDPPFTRALIQHAILFDGTDELAYTSQMSSENLDSCHTDESPPWPPALPTDPGPLPRRSQDRLVKWVLTGMLAHTAVAVLISVAAPVAANSNLGPIAIIACLLFFVPVCSVTGLIAGVYASRMPSDVGAAFVLITAMVLLLCLAVLTSA